MATSKKRKNGSMFGKCPLCQASFPLYKLEHHAADCDGTPATISDSSRKKVPLVEADKRPRRREEEVDVASHNANDSVAAAASVEAVTVTTMNEPLPGLYLYENFITEEEEAQILAELDGVVQQSSSTMTNHKNDPCYLPWQPSTFNGKHLGQRWGVHCNLRDRTVNPAERPLPHFCQNILLPKLAQLLQHQQRHQQQHVQQQHSGGPSLKTNIKKYKRWTFDTNFLPNEANAIDYHRDQGHYLKDHVDDRQLSKEPIANISFAGDCYMTFTNVKKTASAGDLLPSVRQIWLPRRCLQILTGKARYDYSHGIQHCHLLSPRRVSVTMRESPLTTTVSSLQSTTAGVAAAATCRAASSSIGFFTARAVATKKTEEEESSSSSLTIPPTVPLSSRRVSTGIRPWMEQPIPGLYLFHDFLTPEEELAILQELDRPESSSSASASSSAAAAAAAISNTWKMERHSGTHLEKRWGMDHDLWNSRAVRPPKHPLPNFMETIIIPKLQQLPAMIMQGCIPNEVNSIDYRRQLGHSLKLHADDRQKYKEPIANLSLAGDCVMTYRKESSKSNRSLLYVSEKRVLLQRRCLQVLTGKARYDYAHGIANQDLLSDRRVSLTMRQVRP
jgi:alkylated DNA repair dioxygenase AlkB